MSETTKSEPTTDAAQAAPTQAPAAEAKTATPTPVQGDLLKAGPDWEAEAKAASSRLAKIEKEHKSALSKLGEFEGFKAKMSEALGFSADKKADPVAETLAIRENAAKYQSLAVAKAIEAAVVRAAGVFKAKDPDDLVRLIPQSAIEVDLANGGNVTNFDAVKDAIKAIKASKPYLFDDDQPARGVVLPPSKQAPAPQDAAPPPADETPQNVWNMSPKQLREYQQRRNSATH